MSSEHWSKSEKAIANRAFTLALERECKGLIEKVRRRASSIADVEDVWKLNDYLTRQRRAIDEKYDYRYSVLIFVFARLIHEGWLTEDELDGLDDDKMTQIRVMLRMAEK